MDQKKFLMTQVNEFKNKYKEFKDLQDYVRLKNIFVANRQTCKTIRKQEKHKNRPLPADFIAFEKATIVPAPEKPATPEDTSESTAQ